ncbi:MAG: ribbon-helix-helix domain-containing protein [Geminicoccaceae bacterium]
MRIGEVRTSIKLEADFWDYLKEVAESREIRLSTLVNEVARASPERTNLASTLRTFCLIHARLRTQTLQQELERLTLAGNTQDLTRVIEASPLPCVILGEDRTVRRLNRAFSIWLNLEERAVLGQRIENLMIMRGPGIKDMWRRLFEGQVAKSSCNATYVSPGKVRTAQALAIGLSPTETGAHRAALLAFETLAGRA